MSNQIQRKDIADEPENINSNNFITQKENNQTKETAENQRQPTFIASGNSSEEARDLFEKTMLESEYILRKIDEFNHKINKNEDEYIKLQKIFAEHIRAHIHPVASSNIGDILLRNGKFVVGFIEIMTRHEKKDYLKKYLFNYFSDLNKISNQKEIFENARKKQYEQKATDTVLGENQKRGKQTKKKQVTVAVTGSPASSKNQVDWSLATQNDLNLSPQSRLLQSSKRNESEEQLKRENANVAQLVNQENERSEKASKNVKKSSKKTKPKMPENQNKNYIINSQKQTVTKSNKKSKPKSKERKTQSQKKRQNEKEEESQLGSCYHYLLAVNPRNQHKELKQIRTSARLSKKIERVSAQERKRSLRKPSRSKSKKSSKKSKKEQQLIKVESEDSQSQYRAASEYSEFDEENVDWIRNHLRQLTVKDVQLYSDFRALTSNDQKITDFLLQMENSQQAIYEASNRARSRIEQQNIESSHRMKQVEPQTENQEVNEPNTLTIFPNKPNEVNELPYQQEKTKNFAQIKDEYEIKQLPLTIESIIDPNLNNHGIYAFVKLGRVTELQMGTAYAVSPLTYGTRVSRKHIKEDLEKAKQLAGSYGDNIGYIPMNEQILQMINQKREAEQR